MRTARHVSFASAALGLATLACSASGCSQLVVMAEYPVRPSATPAAPAGAVDPAPSDPDDSGKHLRSYWSVYAHMEEQDVLRLWRVSGLDYLLISAEVEIPQSGESIKRDFPLYTINEGHIQAYSGVDLLRRFPVNTQGREQVSIKIEVRYMKNLEALKVAQTILKTADRIAGGYLKNLPFASQVTTEGLTLVDQLQPQKDPPNSLSIFLQPEELEQERVLRAILLRLPDRVEAVPTYSKPLYACTDIHGALCTAAGAKYQEGRLKDEAYLTLEFVRYDDVSDPEVDPGSCESLTYDSLKTSEVYLQSNAQLFHPDDVSHLTYDYTQARRILDARKYAAISDYGALLDLSSDVPARVASSKWDDAFSVVSCAKLTSEASRIGCKLSACEHKFWNRSPAREVMHARWVADGLGALETPADATNKVEYEKKKIDTIGLVLSDLLSLSGQLYEPTNEHMFDATHGSVVRMLDREARVLSKREAQRAADEPPATKDQLDKLSSRYSVYCGECAKILASKLKVDEPTVKNALQSKSIETGLEGLKSSGPDTSSK